MKRILAFTIAFLFGAAAAAQTVSITGTATDSDSIVWANGSWKIQFRPNPAYPNINQYYINGVPLQTAYPSLMNQSGSLSSGGAFSATTVDNTLITPLGSQWTFTICPNAVTACGVLSLGTSGSSQDITTQIDATIPVPRFHGIAGTYGYTDGEAILQLIPGNMYWNVSLNQLRCYTGTGWVSCGSGGGGGGPTIQTNGTNNFSQALLNFTNPASFNGLSFTFSNPSGGIETFGVTGTLNNSGLTNSSTTVNGQTCTLGGSCTVSGGSAPTLQHNGTNLPDQSLLNFVDSPASLSGSPSIPQGLQPVIFVNDSVGGLAAETGAAAAGLLMQLNPPSASAQQYILYPTTSTGVGAFQNAVQCGGSQLVSSCAGTGVLANGGFVAHPFCGLGGCTSNPQITYTFTLPSFITPSSVTGVYGGMVGYTYNTNLTGNAPSFQYTCGIGASQQNVISLYSGGGTLNFATYTQLLTGITGSNVNSVTCIGSENATGPIQGGQFASMSSTFLVINYSGSAAPPNPIITVVPPLNFNPGPNALSISLPFDTAFDNGSSTAYSASIVWLAQQAGTTVHIIPSHNNSSTTPTFSYNGNPAFTIIGPYGGALSLNDISTTQVMDLQFAPNTNNWVLKNPQISSSSPLSFPVNITGSAQITASGCTQSATLGGNCAVSGSTTSSVTFSVIPGTGQSLRIKAWGGTVANTNVNVVATVNSDTGAHYIGEGSVTSGSNNPAPYSAAGANACVVGIFGDAGGSSISMDLPGYADTTFAKTINALQTSGINFASVANSNTSSSLGCGWNNGASSSPFGTITSVTLSVAPSSNDFAPGTKFEVILE